MTKTIQLNLLYFKKQKSCYNNIGDTMNKRKSYKYIVLIFLITTPIILLNISNIKIKFLSKITGYQEATIQTLLKEDIYGFTKEKEYSETLDKIINTNDFKKEYVKDYLNIFYINEKNFIKNINELLNKQYNHKDINIIYQKLSQKSIDNILKENYINNLSKILEIPYFKENNLNRYISYSKKYSSIDLETIVTYVNIGLDNKFYTNIKNIELQDDTLILVNKYHKLKSNYVPTDLQKVSSGQTLLQKEAAIAFDTMCKEAKKENIILYGGSGYRSYDYQNTLYNNYVKQDGKEKADTYSARAGHSEHQTGLAIDIVKSTGNFIYETDKEYTWLINNAYKYGFILRYPKEKENITGYMYEPWHYRYLGVNIAKEIHNLNITYEEYVAKK